MAENRKAEEEPFFWIKTGRPAENRIPEKPPEPEPEKKLADIGAPIPKSRIPIIGTTDSARAGLQPGWIRASFIVREDYLAKLKKKAYWDRKAIKDILDEILDKAFQHDDRSANSGNVDNGRETDR